MFVKLVIYIYDFGIISIYLSNMLRLGLSTKVRKKGNEKKSELGCQQGSLGEH